MKILLPAFIILTITNAAYPQMPDTTSKQKSKFGFDALYYYAIQENVSKILETLDTIPDSTLSGKELEVKTNYFKRFRTQDVRYDFHTTDPLIVNVIKIYQSYWKNVLLGKETLKDADKELNRELSSFLHDNYFKNENIKKSVISDNPRKYLSQILTKHGYFSNVSGRTGNLFDIYIWAKEAEVDYNVELPEATVIVPVDFMEDFITLGWEEYATFGNFYPGGWSTDSLLYCVKKCYDVHSETFQVSYLTHEAQHFYDQNRYLHLSPSALEYRAKLAQMNKAKGTIYQTMNSFINGAKNDRKLSHPYAEYRVVRDLSQVIFHQDYVSDQQKWQSIPYGDINKASDALLKRDSGAFMMRVNKFFAFLK
jgi:hypothetical protein